MLPPLGPATPFIAPYSVVHAIGFSKSLVCKLIVLAVDKLMRKEGSLSITDLSSVQTFIKPLFYVRSIWKGSSGTADDLYQSISGKMQETVRPRPDVVQIAHAFSVQAKIEGVSYESVIDTWLREFNERATSTKKISDLEASIIKILPLQTQVTQQKIAYHWQNF